MIELKNVTKKYTNVDEVQVVLEDINYSFNQGQVTTLLGESGCGKTTVLNLIGGVDNDYEGEIFFNGNPIEDLDSYRREHVSFIFQDLNLVEHFNLIKNITIGMTNEVENKEELAFELLKKVGLEDHVSKKPNQLSGGERQRVAIARALARNTDVLLCDEPTGSLDEETKTEIMDLIMDVFSGKTVIFITHDEDLAKQYADVILEFEDRNFIVTRESEKEVSTTTVESESRTFKGRFESNLLFRKLNLVAASYLIIVIFALYLFGTGVVYGASKEIDKFYIERYKVDKINIGTPYGLTHNGFGYFVDRFNREHDNEIIGYMGVIMAEVLIGETYDTYYYMNTLQEPIKETIEVDIILGRYPETVNEVMFSRGAATSFLYNSYCVQYAQDIEDEPELFDCIDELAALTDEELYAELLELDISFNDSSPFNFNRLYEYEHEIVGMIDDSEYSNKYKGSTIIDSDNSRLRLNRNVFLLEEEMQRYVDVMFFGNNNQKNYSYSIFLGEEDLELRKKVFNEFIIYSYLISGRDFITEERELFNEAVFGYELAIIVGCSILTLFGAVSLYNGLKTNIQKNKANVGVYKSLGYTSNNIRSMFLKEGLVISGVIVSLSVLGWFVLERIFESALIPVIDRSGKYGVENIVRIDPMSVLVVAILLLIVVFGSISYELKKIDIIEMIRE